MEAICPNTPSLKGAAKTIGARSIAGPDSGAESIERIVGDRKRLFIVLEFCHGENGAKYFFLEDAHLVVAFEDRRLDIESAGKLGPHFGTRAASQHLGAFLAADVEIGENFFQLIVRGLRADHGQWVERVALLHRLDPGGR